MRHATEKDLPDLVGLEQLLFEDNWLSDSSLLREIAAPGRNIVVGEPVQGYILSRQTADVIDVTRLGIAPEAQGRGLGRLLLEAILLAADRPVMLNVRKTNARALRLYHRCGFRVVAQIQDSWVMWWGPLA